MAVREFTVKVVREIETEIVISASSVAEVRRLLDDADALDEYCMRGNAIDKYDVRRVRSIVPKLS